MKHLSICAIQSDLVWESPAKNRAAFDTHLESLNQDVDLIILPEMFTTGFSIHSAQLAEEMEGTSHQWMKKWSSQLQAVICGSLIIQEGDSFTNRLIWQRPDGTFNFYDKRHLFRMAGEDSHFAAGQQRCIVELNGIKCCLFICYDLRFPVWSRNTYTNDQYDYDCLIYVANWPSARANAWRDLLRARAIENVAYCVGVNRVGNDMNNLHYQGDSVILDFKGLDLCRATSAVEILSTTIDLEALQSFREKFPVGLDADDFELT